MSGKRFFHLVGRGLASLLVGLTLAAGVGAVPALAQADPINGSCTGYDLSKDVRSAEYPLNLGRGGTALYDGVEVFSSASGGAAVSTLQLGDVVQIIEDSESLDGDSRVGVRSFGGAASDVQYVRRNDLGCANKPLISATTRLERKAVIKVETALSTDATGKAISAYRTPFLNDCDETCRKLSRFDLYFVIAETDKALLLSREVRVVSPEGTPMVGWISKEDVYEWPYSVGLRVREDYTFEGGYGAACGYLSLDEARAAAPETCQPILGGPSWFETDTRLLVMQQFPVDPGDTDPAPENVIFETVAPISSRAGAEELGGKIVDPAALADTDIDVLKRANRIDVFFLIDGTKSMQPYIDSIRGSGGSAGLVQSILGRIQDLKTGPEGLDLGQIKLRAGFRVFRDTNGPSRNSIGEGFALPDQDCPAMTAADSDDNLAAFNRAIADVETTSETGDDYPEDLYGGFEQSLIDMAGCSENRKLVFIITDAGYDAQMQASRGVTVPDLDDLTAQFNDEFKGGAIFFLRPARNTNNTSEDYNSAYDDLVTEASSVLYGLGLVQDLQAEGVENPASDFFVQLGGSSDAADVVARVEEHVVKNINPAIIDALIIDIRGGASLQQAIERLRTERTDIPAYFWRLVERSACEDLGDACTTATFQSVQKVYVRNELDKIALDVWMDTEQLKAWDDLLAAVTRGELNYLELRTEVVSALDDAIRNIIREPPYEDDTEILGDYLARAGVLPTGFNTPLLGYSLADILREERVSMCELSGLVTWLKASRQMLEIARNGSTLPDYTVAEEGLSCSTPVTEAGRLIRNPTSAIGERDLGTGNLRSSSADNPLAKPIYWIPQVYLP